MIGRDRAAPSGRGRSGTDEQQIGPRGRAAQGARPEARDVEFETALRGADPLPDAEQLHAELDVAVERTRRAVGVRSSAPASHAEARSVMGPAAAFVVYPAPWGPLHIAADDDGLVAIDLRTSTERFVEDLARRLHGAPVPDQPGLPEAWRTVLARARLELDEYFSGERHTFDLPVDLRGVSDWDRRVLEAARGLGFGQVTSYGGLARRIGRPRAARAVGGALGRNPIPLVIPCHRIVAADGSLGGYGGGGHGSRIAMLAVKRSLLDLEGVTLPAQPGR